MISIITPAYNEEKLLIQFVESVVDQMKKIDKKFELLIIENGSTDNTLKITKEASLNKKELRVFHQPKPSYGQALKLGILKARGQYVFIFNIDFWDINFLKKSLNLLGDYDLIIGSKNLKGSCDQRSFSRRLITHSFNICLKLFFGFRGTDTHGLKGFKRELIQPIAKRCLTKNEIFDTEIVLRAQKSNLKIKEVPIKVKELRPSRQSVLKRIPNTIMDLWILTKMVNN